jgi:DNA-binding MarR family transcriptional regulator
MFSVPFVCLQGIDILVTFATNCKRWRKKPVKPKRLEKQTGEFEPAEFELENFLPYRLSLLTNTVSQGIAASYRDEHDISVTEWRILAVLGRFPGLTAKEVTERTAMDKVAISRAVKNLMARKLLRRKTDHEDRRRRQLFISAGRGEEVLRKVIPKARQYEQFLLDALTPSEASALDNALSKLQNHVGAGHARE